MKIFLIGCLMFLFQGCSSSSSDWDTGDYRKGSMQEQQQEESVENTNRQLTTPGQVHTEQDQPF